MNAKTLSLIVVVSCATALIGCQGCSGDGGSADTSATDSHTQSSSDTGSESQSASATTDTDGTGSESVTQTATSPSTVSGDTMSSDSGSGTGTGPDTDSDTWPLPDGCEVVSLSNAITWDGARSIDGNRMVWSEYNYGKAVPELRMRDLTTGEVTVLVSDNNWEDRNAIFGNAVFFDEELVPGDWTTREVFSMGTSAKEKKRITDDSCADARAIGGTTYVVHTKICYETGIEALYYTNHGVRW